MKLSGTLVWFPKGQQTLCVSPPGMMKLPEMSRNQPRHSLGPQVSCDYERQLLPFHIAIDLIKTLGAFLSIDGFSPVLTS